MDDILPYCLIRARMPHLLANGPCNPSYSRLEESAIFQICQRVVVDHFPGIALISAPVIVLIVLLSRQLS